MSHVAVCKLCIVLPAALNETLLKTSTSLAFGFNECTASLHADALYGELALLFSKTTWTVPQLPQLLQLMGF